MKSRPLTYFLILVVLAVWGVIAKKMLTPAPSSNVAVGSGHTSSVPADTVSAALWLNYRDPFGACASVDVHRQPTFVEPLPVATVAPPREQITLICTGQITKHGIHYCIIAHEGRQHIVCRGDSVGGFRLTAIRGDSLVFTRKGQSYCIAQHDQE